MVGRQSAKRRVLAATEAPPASLGGAADRVGGRAPRGDVPESDLLYLAFPQKPVNTASEH